MAAVVILSVAILICEVHTQICGPAPGPMFPGTFGLDSGCYGPGPDPFLPGCIQNIAPCLQVPCNIPSFTPNQISPGFINPGINLPCPQVMEYSTPSIIGTTVPCATVAAPVVATTIVDNTLANSLANAIQLLIVSNLIENTLGSFSGVSLAQSLDLLGAPCVNNFEVVTPDGYPQGFNSDGFLSNFDVPRFQEPVTYPCADVPCSSGNFGSYSLDNNVQYGCDKCGMNAPFGTSSAQLPFGCSETVVPTLAPVALEVPFPASIPAQLLCNFGYLPTNVPCVTVNVEPLPFNGCNMLGNNVFF